MTAEMPEPDETDKVGEPTENSDDGRRGTLDKPRREDEGGDGVNDTIPDA